VLRERVVLAAGTAQACIIVTPAVKGFALMKALLNLKKNFKRTIKTIIVWFNRK